MQFFLTGFTPGTDFRDLTFEGVGTDKTRTEFTVRTDLSLIRRYGIRVQELPLLCRALLERRDEQGQEHKLTFTEEEMRIHASNCALNMSTVQRKRPVRQSVSVK
jgi:hypothetical protein